MKKIMEEEHDSQPAQESDETQGWSLLYVDLRSNRTPWFSLRFWGASREIVLKYIFEMLQSAPDGYVCLL